MVQRATARPRTRLTGAGDPMFEIDVFFTSIVNSYMLHVLYSFRKMTTAMKGEGGVTVQISILGN